MQNNEGDTAAVHGLWRTGRRHPMSTSHRSTHATEEPAANYAATRGKGVRPRMEAACSTRACHSHPMPHLRTTSTTERPVASGPHHPGTTRRNERSRRSSTPLLQHRQRQPHPTRTAQHHTVTQHRRTTHHPNTQRAHRYTPHTRRRVGRHTPYPPASCRQTQTSDPGPSLAGRCTVWGL